MKLRTVSSTGISVSSQWPRTTLMALGSMTVSQVSILVNAGSS